ncbi:hypothetical protein [Paraflavitalea pollutisoli]|uniref:hypothetical protein n=1 Tax=Paraflavitalea pollutisoli TaxID=3034143 RepID=UPI0023ED27E5|nr:hypothetical protein [Paraflavitalea sp. H1-2-19X]
MLTDSATKVAHQAPALGLTPLTLVITAVAAEQDASKQYNVRRIQGTIKGTMANVQKDTASSDCRIVGKAHQLTGNFNVLCYVRK